MLTRHVLVRNARNTGRMRTKNTSERAGSRGRDQRGSIARHLDVAGDALIFMRLFKKYSMVSNK